MAQTSANRESNLLDGENVTRSRQAKPGQGKAVFRFALSR